MSKTPTKRPAVPNEAGGTTLPAQRGKPSAIQHSNDIGNGGSSRKAVAEPRIVYSGGQPGNPQGLHSKGPTTSPSAISNKKLDSDEEIPNEDPPQGEAGFGDINDYFQPSQFAPGCEGKPPRYLKPVFKWLNSFGKEEEEEEEEEEEDKNENADGDHVKKTKVVRKNPNAGTPPLWVLLDSIYKRVEETTCWEEPIKQVTFDKNPGGGQISMNSLLSIEVSGGFAAECVYEFHGDLIPKVNQKKRKERVDKWRAEGEEFVRRRREKAEEEARKANGIGCGKEDLERMNRRAEKQLKENDERIEKKIERRIQEGRFDDEEEEDSDN